MLGRMETEFHQLLDDLKSQRLEYEKTLAELERRGRMLAEQERHLSARRAGWEAERKESIEKAYRDAREIVAGVKREANALLEEARRERSRASLKKIAEVEERVEEKLRGFGGEPSLDLDQVHEGDMVFVRSIGFDAVVRSVDSRSGRIRLSFAGKELEVGLADVAPRKGAAPKPSRKTRKKVEPREEAPLELHLIGLRVDDAVKKLEPFLNHASLDGIGEVRIVHGKGTGALMRGVREYLDGHLLVESFRDGEPFEGGSGVTVVRIRQ
jgi:DNA mismatch repair protein MutS2